MVPSSCCNDWNDTFWLIQLKYEFSIKQVEIYLDFSLRLHQTVIDVMMLSVSNVDSLYDYVWTFMTKSKCYSLQYIINNTEEYLYACVYEIYAMQRVRNEG